MEFILLSFYKEKIDLVVKRKESGIKYEILNIEEVLKFLETQNISILVFKDNITYKKLKIYLLECNYQFIILEEFITKEYEPLLENIDFRNKNSLYFLSLINSLAVETTGEIFFDFISKNYLKNFEIVLENKNILFTGKLIGLKRGEAMERVRKLGGNPISTYSEKVDILVCGTTKNNRISNKQNCVNNAIRKGKDILIINENKFFEIIK